ncbi:MAG: MopE-related protein [Patescibacteria group bacterium]
MEKFKMGALCLVLWFLLPRNSEAEEFLYLPITRTPVITSGFCGYRTASGACHGGIDYDVRDDGDGIFAAADGVVEVAEDGWLNTYHGRRVYGNYVQILHDNGYRTIYAHFKRGSLEVSVGDEVSVGQLLGIGDNSGWSTGSHLHFEVRDSSGRKVDPYGDSPSYPNCGANHLWVNCPPTVWVDEDRDADTWTVEEGDCDDTNPNIYPGAVERCNGVDDNCADGVDEEPAASYACRDSVDCTIDACMVGAHVCTNRQNDAACEDGDPCTTNLCIILTGCRAIPKDTDLDGFVDISCGGDDCDDSNMAIRPDAAEKCNNIDDDCDTETDEDWLLLGTSCNVGFGECRRSGIWVCEPLERATVCDAEYISGTPELCDGLDNDCDTETDEDWPELGTACGIFPCDGTYVCSLGGSGSYCNASPGMPETCDGLDNDCDGETDESPAEFSCGDGNDCTVDSCVLGACRHFSRDRDGDTHGDDLCGGTDCNDLNPAVWEYAFSESRLTNSAGDSNSPAVAWTGSELGIVWEDWRAGIPNAEIYFARADTSLARIGDEVRVTNASWGSREPSLSWTGSEYGVAWYDLRVDSRSEVFFTRLDSTGLEIGDDIQLTDHFALSGASYELSLTWTGSDYGIVFQDSRLSSMDIFFVRLDSGGIAIAPEAPAISDSGPESFPVLVWTGSQYGLAYTVSIDGYQQIFFARFDSSGVRTGAVTRVASFDSGGRFYAETVDLVWQGREFALVWTKNMASGAREVYFRRLDAAGVPLAPEVLVATSPDIIYRVAIAWNGREYGVIWQESSGMLANVYFVRLAEAGSRLGTVIRISSTARNSEKEVVVWTGHEYVMAWSDNRDSDWEIYLGRVSCGW